MKNKKTIAIILLIFLFFIGIYFMISANILVNLKENIITEIESNYPLKIELADISLWPLNSLKLHEVKVSTNEDESIFYSSVITVEYSILEIIRNRQELINSLKKIIIEEPIISEKALQIGYLFQGGNFNLEEFFALERELEITDAYFNIFDNELYLNRFLINSKKVLDSLPQLLFTSTVDIEKLKWDDYLITDLFLNNLDISLFISENEWYGNIETDSFYLDSLAELFNNLDLAVSIEDLSAQGKLNLSFLGTGAILEEYQGSLLLEEIKGLIAGQKLSVFKGELNYDSRSKLLDIVDVGFNYSQSPYFFTANLNFKQEDPLIEGKLISDKLNLEQLAFLPVPYLEEISGISHLKLDLTGNLFEPEINLDLIMPQGKFAGQKIEDLNVEINYQEDIFYFNEFNFAYSSSYIEGRGQLNPTLNNYSFDLTTRDLAVEVFADYIGYELNEQFREKINTELTIIGNSFNLEDLSIKGKVNIPNLNIATYDIKDLQLEIVTEEQKIFVKQGKFDLETAVFNFTGLIDLKDNDIDLELFAADVELAIIKKIIGEDLGQIEGLLNLSANISQSIDNPLITLELSMDKAKIRDYELDNFKSELLYKDEYITIQDLVLSYQDILLRANGFIDIQDSKPVLEADLQLSSPVKQISPLQGDIKLWAQLNLESKPRLSAKFSGEDLFLNIAEIDYLIDKTDLAVNWSQEQALIIEQFVAVKGDSVLSASGALQKEDLLLDLIVSNLDIKEISLDKLLNFDSLSEIAAELDLKAELSGTYREPKIKGIVSTRGLKYEDIKFGSLTAPFKFKNNNFDFALDLSQLVLLDNLSETDISLQGKIKKETKGYYLNLDTDIFLAEDSDLQRIIASIEYKEGKPLSLKQEVFLAEDMSVSFSANLPINEENDWNQYWDEIANLETELVLAELKKLINLQLEDITQLYDFANYYPDLSANFKKFKHLALFQDLDINVEFKDLDLSLIDQRILGKITGDIALKGSVLEPQLEGSLFLKELGTLDFLPVKLSSFNGKIDFLGQNIYFNNLKGKYATEDVLINGKLKPLDREEILQIELAANSFAADLDMNINKDSFLELNLLVDKANLRDYEFNKLKSQLSYKDKKVEIKELLVDTKDFYVKAQGLFDLSASQPYLLLEAFEEDTFIKYANDKFFLDEIKLILNLQDETIKLEELLLLKGDSSLLASGKLKKEELSLDFIVNRLDLGEIPFLFIEKDLRDTIAGNLDLTAKLSGNYKEPEIKGQITANGLKYEEIVLDSVNAPFIFKDNILEFKEIELDFLASKYYLTAKLGDLAEGNYDIRLYTKKGDLRSILELANLDVQLPDDYKFKGDIRLRGSFLEPFVNTQLVFLSSNLGSLSLRGNLYPQVDLDLSAENIDLSQIPNLAEGTLAFQGKIREDNTAYSFSIDTDLLLAKERISGNIAYKEGQALKLKQELFLAKDNSIKFSANLPIKANSDWNQHWHQISNFLEEVDLDRLRDLTGLEGFKQISPKDKDYFHESLNNLAQLALLQNLDVHVEFNNLDLALIDNSMQAYINGVMSLKGSFLEPDIGGSLFIEKATVFTDFLSEKPAYFNGQLDFSGQDIYLQGKYDQEVLIKGKIRPFQLEDVMDLQISTKGYTGFFNLDYNLKQDLLYLRGKLEHIEDKIDIAQLLHELGLDTTGDLGQITGPVNFSASVNITDKEPGIDFKVIVDEANLRDYHLSDLTTELSYRENNLELKKLVVYSQDRKIKGEGFLDLSDYSQPILKAEFGLEDIILRVTGLIAKENFDLDINIDNLAVKQIPLTNDLEMEFIDKLATSLNLTANITGKYTDPEIKGSIKPSILRYEDIVLDNLTGEYYFKDNILSLREFNLTFGKNIFNLEGEIGQLGDLDYDIRLFTKEGDLSSILEELDFNLPIPDDYDLIGEVELKGSFAQASGLMDLKLNQRSGDGILKLQGELLPQLDLSLLGENIELSQVAKLDFQGTVRGDLKDYNLELATNLLLITEDIGSGFSNLKGQIEYQASDFISIEQKVLLDNEASFLLSGNIPLKVVSNIGTHLSTLEQEPLLAYEKAGLLQQLSFETYHLNLKQGFNYDLTSPMLNIDREDYFGIGLSHVKPILFTGLTKEKNHIDLIQDLWADFNSNLNISVEGDSLPQQGNNNQGEELNKQINQLEDLIKNLEILEDLDEIELTIQLHKLPLSLISSLVDNVPELKGELTGDLLFTGTINNPNLDGSLTMKEVAMDIEAISANISQLNGYLDFSGQEIRLRELKGNINQGDVNISGLISPLEVEAWDLEIKGSKLPFRYGSFNGDFDSQVQVTGSFFTPLISGELLIYDFIVGLPIEWPQGEGKARLFSPELNLVLYPKQDVYVADDNIDILVQSGNLNVIYLGQELSLGGVLSSQRGSFDYYNNKFMLDSGKAVFNKFNGYIPDLEIKARTHISGHRIDINLEGPAVNMVITFGSQPSLTEEEILTLLTSKGGLGELAVGNWRSVIQKEIFRVFNDFLQIEFISNIEEKLKDFFSLQHFEIDAYNLGWNQEVTFYMGKYFHDNIYFQYTNTITPDTQRGELAFQYYLQENVLLEGSMRGEKDYSLSMEYNIPF